MTGRITTAGLVLLALAGCTPAAAPTPSPTAPETRAITVKIVDTVPLAVYWNLDDSQCTAQRYMAPKVDRGPQVTIADGNGKILATQDAPLHGGTAKIEDSCTVDIEFPSVPTADVYVVTVKGHDGQSWDRTVQAEGASQTIQVDA